MTQDRYRLRFGCNPWTQKLIAVYLEHTGQDFASWYKAELTTWFDAYEQGCACVWASPTPKGSATLALSLGMAPYKRFEELKGRTGHTWSDLGWSVLVHGLTRYGVDELVLRDHGRRPTTSIWLTPSQNHMVRMGVLIGLQDSLSALVEAAMEGWLEHREACGVFGPLYPVDEAQARTQRISVTCRLDLYERVRLWARHDDVGIKHALESVVAHFIEHEFSAQQREVLAGLEGFGR